MRVLIALALLAIAHFAHAGDAPEVLFKLGLWEFQLSTVRDGHGRIDSVLVARHKTKKGIVGFSRMDQRVCATARDILERDHKLGRAASEFIVELAGPNWTSSETFAAFPADAPDRASALQTFLAALRTDPPTRGYKERFDFITAQHAPR